MSIWSKISKTIDFGQNFRKYRFWSKLSKVLDFEQNLQKSRIWSQLSKYLDFGQNCRKFSILVKTYHNVDFGQIAENDYSQIFETCQFGSKFANIMILLKKIPKSWFWWFFLKI